jgi:hypothetical protein
LAFRDTYSQVEGLPRECSGLVNARGPSKRVVYSLFTIVLGVSHMIMIEDHTYEPVLINTRRGVHRSREVRRVVHDLVSTWGEVFVSA